ncbi:thiolase family protein [Cupriavidus sp. AU9028]|uniref:thiolase family protein n=1 Tax=Cupriavidus sp. AU9028 TaxID=2871157 RepID=UPI001C952C9B|nr:thiolase family protein [Cupriavidus sp. AU9028]MBY4898472.1 thiolase family protein [Cupriavidus sp. AU9028]
MTAWIDGNGGVYVAGIGLHPYQFPSDTPYTHLGLTAVRAALADAGLRFADLDSAYVGTTSIGMAAGRVMLRHLGSTGLAVTQVENASASGSFAFRQACQEIAVGQSDIVLAVGVDKHGDGRRAANKDGLERLSDTATIPAVKFAMMARRYLRERGAGIDAMAGVAVKNHGNAARNPFAQFRKPRTLQQVLASPKVVGDLTVQQCCPRGDGAAAVVLVSGRAMARLGLTADRCIRVLSSVAGSEREETEYGSGAIELVRRSATAACEAAGVGPRDLDLLELHDAFSVEELLYSEAIGVCEPGDGAGYLLRGESAIGGRCAINASGGLIGMGHPLGPTGIGQIAELTRQLRGEAGDRQHSRARLGMAHMIGLGSVAIAHVLAAPPR